MYLNFRDCENRNIRDNIPIIKVRFKKSKKEEIELNNEIGEFYEEIDFKPKYLNSSNLLNKKEFSFSDFEKGELEVIQKKENLIDSFEILENNRKLLEKIKFNFKEMDKKQKLIFFIILTFSSIVYILGSVYIFKKYFFENIKTIEYTQFICFGVDLLNKKKFCIIAIGQKSFGFLSIGQISIGFIALGQISLGFFTIGQASFAFFFQYIGQVSISAICWYSQIGITLIYNHASMLSTSPLRPLFKREKKPYVLCCV